MKVNTLKKDFESNNNCQTIHYDSLDGLRTISCLGIILMHIQANTNYQLEGGFLFDKFIPSLTWLVYLFLMISGFGMCVGYLEKFKTGAVDLEKFYKKRYMKSVPFLASLLIIALIMEPNRSTFYEASIEVLLLHGLLPNNAVSVIGVCWTLGVIFLFYLLFPAFSVLMKNKKRAWSSLLISLWVVYVCESYFFSDYFVANSFTPRHNFLYCLPMFIVGGIAYLYREKIKNICQSYKHIVLALNFFVSVVWYLIPVRKGIIFYLSTVGLYSLWLSYAVGGTSAILSRKPMRFFAKISMEMYLAQMVIFRAVEKLNMIYVFGNSGVGGTISFILTFILTIIGLLIYVYCYKCLIYFLNKRKENLFGEERIKH